MASYVNDLWKKVGELRLGTGMGMGSSSSSSLPSSASPLSTHTHGEGSGRRCGIWQLHVGREKTSKGIESSSYARVSIFVCSQSGHLATARTVVRQLKTLRHPHVLRYLDSRESDKEVVLATEYVRPYVEGGALGTEDDAAMGELFASEQWRGWAAWCANDAVRFLHHAGRSHGRLAEEDGVFVTAAGVVKIAGFVSDGADGHVVSLDEDLEAIRRLFGTEGTVEGNYLMELSQGMHLLPSLAPSEKEVFLRRLGREWSRLPSPVKKHLVLPELVKLRQLPDAAVVPPSAEEARLLFSLGPEVMRSQNVEEKSAERTHGADGVRSPGERLVARDAKGAEGNADFMRLLAPPLRDALQRHATNPPGLTGLLLEQLAGPLVPLLSSKFAQETVYPVLAALMASPAPAMREAALRAMLPLAPTLDNKTLSNDLLRLLARMQSDPEGPIRLQTIRLLLQIAPLLPPAIRAKIVGPALARALQDATIPVRHAALLLLGRRGGEEDVSVEECATRLFPLVTPLLVDANGSVQGAALQCAEMLLGRLKRRIGSQGGNSTAAMETETGRGTQGMQGESACKPSTQTQKGIMRTDDMHAPLVKSPAISPPTQTTAIPPPTHPSVIPPPTQTTTTTTRPTKMKLGSIKKIA